MELSINTDEKQLYQTIKNLELQVTQQHDLLAQLTKLDINNLTPRQALEFIWNLKEKLNPN